MLQRRLLLLAQTVAAAALLAACGGGGDGGYNAPAPAPMAGPLDAVPGAASQSSTGMTSYLKTLSTLAPEDREPVDLSTFMPPTTEDAEPDSIS